MLSVTQQTIAGAQQSVAKPSLLSNPKTGPISCPKTGRAAPLIAIAMQKSTSIDYPILWRRQIQLCLNTVRKVECHLSQESSPIVAMASHFGQNT